MTSTTDRSQAVRSTLDATAQREVTDRLQPLLVDVLELTLTAKQLHWNVIGTNFKPLHEHLDEVVDEYRTWSDQIAERLTSIGVAPDGRAQRIAGDSPEDPAPQGYIAQEDVVQVMTDRIEAVARRTRERLDGLGEVDLPSEDLLIAILDGLEMQLWMFSAQLA